MILVGLGANLVSPDFPTPRDTLLAALARLEAAGAGMQLLSRWYCTAPVPRSDQPWYVNAVAAIDSALGPPELLALLLATERALGRRRGPRNAPRIIDLDLIAYHDVVNGDGPPPLLPHPRMARRAFVLRPLADVAPGWRHPVLDVSVEALCARLPADQAIELLEPAQAPQRAIGGA